MYICTKNIIMEIIDRLSQERKMKYISQEKMSAKLGITITTLCRYETKKREIPLSVAANYAVELGLELKLIM